MLRLLGERSLWHDGRDASCAVHYRKGWALLGYLVVERERLHPREQVAELLWPNLGATAARTNLRQVVADLNQVFDGYGAGGLLDTTREHIGLFPAAAPGFGIDLLSLDAVARLPDAPDAGAVAAVEQEAERLGGEFMAGLELPDCRGYGEWLAATRRLLGQSTQEALVRLARAQQALGRVQQAISTTRKLVAMDGWHEGYVRQLMALLAAAGLHAQALEQYEVLQDSLRRELDIDPESRTQALRAQVEADQRRLAASADPARAAPHSLAAQVRRWLGELARDEGHPGGDAGAAGDGGGWHTQRTLALTGAVPGARIASAWLEVEDGSDAPRRVAISPKPVVIGRSRDSDVCIVHDTVSRQHCAVWDDEGVFRVRDLGSTNGTRVNDATVQEAALGSGDCIVLGGTVLRFRCAEGADPDSRG